MPNGIGAGGGDVHTLADQCRLRGFAALLEAIGAEWSPSLAG
jgi:hypothetical protein